LLRAILDPENDADVRNVPLQQQQQQQQPGRGSQGAGDNLIHAESDCYHGGD